MRLLIKMKIKLIQKEVYNMFIYEKDGKLNMILGEEGKRQFPAGTKVPEAFKNELVIPETPDVVVKKVDGNTSIDCKSTESVSSDESKENASEDPAAQPARSKKVKG